MSSGDWCSGSDEATRLAPRLPRECRLERAAFGRCGSRIAPDQYSHRPSSPGADRKSENRSLQPRNALPGHSPASASRRDGAAWRCEAGRALRDTLLHEPAVDRPILPAALHHHRAVRRILAWCFALRAAEPGNDNDARIASSDACIVTLSVCATCLSNENAPTTRSDMHRVCGRRFSEASVRVLTTGVESGSSTRDDGLMQSSTASAISASAPGRCRGAGRCRHRAHRRQPRLAMLGTARCSCPV